MATKSKKATPSKRAARKATAAPGEAKDLSLDDLESVAGGVTLRPPAPNTMATAACSQLPQTDLLTASAMLTLRTS